MSRTGTQALVDPLLPWHRLRRRAAALAWRAGMTLGAWLAQRRAARQRARERHALRQLSPHVLRDIGAPEEVLIAATAWRDAQDANQSRLFRGY
jgi:uncharacterized protein YjiS (DUF1127 family)